MTSLIYDTGTVSVTNGSAVVTGTGTGWSVALIRYGLFSCAGLSIPIASVESDTSLTLAYDWPGTSGAEKPYALYLNSDHAGNAVWTNRLITDVIKNLALVGIHPDGAGTLAERDALDPTPSTGYIWLYVESGYDLAIYRKTDSGWEGPFAVRGVKGDTGDPGPAGDGFNLAGEWDNSTSYDANDTVWHGGRTFASKVDGNVGNKPPSADEDDTYWQFVPAAQGAKGDKGDKGDKGEKGDTGPAWDGWQGEWVTSTAYDKLDTVERGGSSYICTSAHTSGSTTEPGVGADWQTVWDLVAAKGQDGAGTGDVVGPASSTDGEVALFDGETGKLLKGAGTSRLVPSGNADEIPYYSAPGEMSLTSLTSYARDLLGASDGEELQAAMGINILRDYAVSLYPDSGRFAGNSAKSSTIGAFEFPSYMSLYNSATVASAGKFIHNNNDYGGAAGSLPATVKDLVDKIRSPLHRRYGLEFYVAEFTMGSGTAGSATNVGGTNYYISLFSSPGPITPRMTFHAYIRAIDAPILWFCFDGVDTLIRDGVPYTTHQLITPADGWVSMAVHHEINPYESVGYQPEIFLIRAAQAGHRYQIACPALMGGITNVDPNVGLIAGINRWLP